MWLLASCTLRGKDLAGRFRLASCVSNFRASTVLKLPISVQAMVSALGADLASFLTSGFASALVLAGGVASAPGLAFLSGSAATVGSAALADATNFSLFGGRIVRVSGCSCCAMRLGSWRSDAGAPR